MNKVIRDGKIAVLYSPGYGAGWFSWNTFCPQCVFSPEIVNLIEEDRNDEVTPELCSMLFGDEFYSGGSRDLKIQWIPEGSNFTIDEYDGFESIHYMDKIEYLTA
jgi:hypothetical protein